VPQQVELRLGAGPTGATAARRRDTGVGLAVTAAAVAVAVVEVAVVGSSSAPAGAGSGVAHGVQSSGVALPLGSLGSMGRKPTGLRTLCRADAGARLP
jgi:hypothetical protein